MDTFYCIGCRRSYPVDEVARLTSAAHRDGEPVGFCTACARLVEPDVEAAIFADEDFADAEREEEPVVTA
jgi:hypothetical protein